MKEHEHPINDLNPTRNSTKFEVKLGEKKYLPDGGEIEVLIEDELHISSNPSRASWAEAGHIVLNKKNVKSAKINGDGSGETQVFSFDKVQTAAHRGDGDGHDRFITEMQGFDYDSAAQTANSILATKQDEQYYVAGYLEIEKSITGNQAREAIDRVNNGENILIKYKDSDGNIQTKTEEGIKRGEIVLFQPFEEELPSAA